MTSNICLSTTIQKPKKIVRNAIIEAIGIFKNNIISENKFNTQDYFHFRFKLKNNNYSTPISNVHLTIDIQDFPIDLMSSLKVIVHYDLNKNDWLTRVENWLIIRPLIKKNSRKSLFDFKRKVEKWM